MSSTASLPEPPQCQEDNIFRPLDMTEHPKFYERQDFENLILVVEPDLKQVRRMFLAWEVGPRTVHSAAPYQRLRIIELTPSVSSESCRWNGASISTLYDLEHAKSLGAKVIELSRLSFKSRIRIAQIAEMESPSMNSSYPLWQEKKLWIVAILQRAQNEALLYDAITRVEKETQGWF